MGGRGGIYAIRHLASGKMYIGSAANISKRWQHHRLTLSKGTHRNRHLQRAWNKWGPDAFVWEVLQIVEDKADLVRIEQEYLDHFGTYWRTRGFNIYREATSPLGTRHSEEHRAKNAAAKRGTRHSPETRAKMSAAHTGLVFSPEHRANMSAARVGMVFTPEHLANLAEAHRGKKASAETRAKMSATRKGKRLSAETRAKMSLAAKDRWKKMKGTPPQGTLFHI